MNPASTSFVLAYHGCDRQVAERVFAGQEALRPSQNDYDWLGDGIYFWEHNAHRAYTYACEIRKRPRHVRHKVREPAVVGAIIDLALCLNLLDSRFIELVRQAHDHYREVSKEAGTAVPVNSSEPDLLQRRLDNAVIRFLHTTRDVECAEPFDTVRAAFFEGERLYPNAGFAAKNHIQICVRNPRCIKGYFRPLDDEGGPMAFG